MPVLHLRLNSNTQVVKLESQIPVQHLALKMYSVSWANGNYVDDCLKIDIEGGTHFLAHGLSNNDRNSVQDTKISLFCQNDVYNRRTAYYPDLVFTGSDTIPSTFTVKLYKEDGSTLVTSADLTALHLYFQYDNDDF